MIYSAVTMLITALSELAQIITDLRNNNVHLLNYFQYMDIEEEKTETRKEEAKTKREKETGNKTLAGRDDSYEIVCEKVSFHYPESEEMVLQDINLRIAPGEKLAIVGENGSGKTTLIKLLCP